MNIARLKIWARLIHAGRRAFEDVADEDREAVAQIYNEMYPPAPEPEPTEPEETTEENTEVLNDGNSDNNAEYDTGRSDAEDLRVTE